MNCPDCKNTMTKTDDHYTCEECDWDIYFRECPYCHHEISEDDINEQECYTCEECDNVIFFCVECNCSLKGDDVFRDNYDDEDADCYCQEHYPNQEEINNDSDEEEETDEEEDTDEGESDEEEDETARRNCEVCDKEFNLDNEGHSIQHPQYDSEYVNICDECVYEYTCDSWELDENEPIRCHECHEYIPFNEIKKSSDNMDFLCEECLNK